MRDADLTLLRPHLAACSIDDREIVLLLAEAIAAIDHLERAGRQMLGREGWLLYSDGGKGHSFRHQETVGLSDLSVSWAAELCRTTMQQKAAAWSQAPETPGAALYFCITVDEA